jgi:2-polyprenyl-6-methoxyphenol hydroxylase-like FAD-dependent oxidoreductase
MLLEAHTNFERDFRGNTLSSAVMEIMDDLGLADRLLQLRHTKIPRFTVQTAARLDTFADFTRLKTRYPYVTMLPQVSFLEFITTEAQRYPHVRVVMGARVQEVIEEDGEICGVRYHAVDGWHEVRASLTVGADGRFSRIRRLAGMEPITTAPPLDVLWFYLPRRPEDHASAGAIFRLGHGSLLVLMEHVESWQVGYIIAKGSYRRLRAAGLPALRRSIAALAPEFADRVEHLQAWKQISLLSVESSRLRRWYRPGLLVIGDAAHAMSPVGGVGINYAIQDAVVAANVLARPLKAGQLRLSDLHDVQRRREWPTRLIQAVQALAHRWVVARALASTEPVNLGTFLRLCLRLPMLRTLSARLIAFDLRPASVQSPCPISSLVSATRSGRRCRWPTPAHAAVVPAPVSSRSRCRPGNP